MKISLPPCKLLAVSVLSLFAGNTFSAASPDDSFDVEKSLGLADRLYHQTLKPGSKNFGQCLGQYVLTPRLQELQYSQAEAANGRVVIAESDRLAGERTGVVELQGNVSISDGQRLLLSERAVLNQDQEQLRFPQGLVVRENNLVLQGERASLGLDGNSLSLGSVQWVLTGQNLRGVATSLQQTSPGQVVLRGAQLTRCLPGSKGWSLSVDRLELNESAGYAQARGAVLKVKSLPVAYLPQMRVSLDGQRVSGWQMPTGGVSSRDGLELQLPYFMQVSPELNATIAPRWVSRRGIGIAGRMRYDSHWQSAAVDLSYLPSDDLYNGFFDRKTYKALGGERALDAFQPADRWLVAVDQAADWGPLSAMVDFSRSSDRDFFRDLDSYVALTNPNALNQFVELAFTTPKLDVRLRSLGFQRLDELDLADHEVSPALLFDYQSNPGGQGLAWAVNGQLAEFSAQRARRPGNQPGQYGAEGRRFHLEPSISLRQGSLGGFWALRGGYKLTDYDLDRPAAALGVTNATDRHRRVGFVTADTGWFLERGLRLGERRLLQTLEPRVFYLHQEFEAQDSLPVFDSIPRSITLADFFSENRFTGLDRVGDARRLTVAATSRLLTLGGEEKASISLAYMDHLSAPRVSWPTYEDIGANDLLASEQKLRLSDRWRFRAWQLWNEDQGYWEELRGSLHLRGKGRRVYNFGVSRRTLSDIKQTEFSAYLPLNQNIAVTTRWHYDVKSHRTLEAFFGLEYDDCCLKMRLIARQYLENPSYLNFGLPPTLLPVNQLRTDRGILLEVQLKGIAGFGSKVDALLRRSVYGYGTANY